MSDQNHDEIGRRLRETGTVPAPDRLRREVMDQVRAEPRRRRSRRSFFAPVLPYAAAAAVLLTLIVAISHLDLGSGGVNSAGGGASAGGTRLSPEASGARGGLDHLEGNHRVFNLPPSDAQKLAQGAKVSARRSAQAIILAVPARLYAEYRRRLTKIEQRTPNGPTVRVILRRVP